MVARQSSKLKVRVQFSYATPDEKRFVVVFLQTRNLETSVAMWCTASTVLKTEGNTNHRKDVYAVREKI